MNVLIIVSILVIIIWYGIYYAAPEGFDDTPIDPKVEQKYQQFVSFYNPFLVNWEKAMVTSIGLDTPVKPLTDPSDVSNATFKTPSRTEINDHIKKLGEKINKKLPPLTDPIPTTLTPSIMTDVTQHISMDPEIYQNALDFMVKNQEDAHNQMEAMKKSPEGFDPINPYWNIEGFGSCDDYKKCMTDPDVIDAIAAAQLNQQSRRQKKKENDFENKLDKFNMNTSVKDLSSRNAEFLKKAEEIQEKAKNGTLLNDFDVSMGDTSSLDHFIKPQGIYKLDAMKKDNPQQYAEYEKNNTQLMSIAGLLNGISNTLANK
jgi:hypothetical protein